jgi:hypothetical protein
MRVRSFGINLGGELKKPGDEKQIEAKGEALVNSVREQKLQINFIFIQKLSHQPKATSSFLPPQSTS